MSSLSTHVLDTERGVPAAGLHVLLYRDTQLLADAETAANGRIADLADALPSGTYRLVFDVGSYLRAQGRGAPFLQRVSVEFTIEAAQSHYHVPLLLTPYACTSYRGA